MLVDCGKRWKTLCKWDLFCQKRKLLKFRCSVFRTFHRGGLCERVEKRGCLEDFCLDAIWLGFSVWRFSRFPQPFLRSENKWGLFAWKFPGKFRIWNLKIYGSFFLQKNWKIKNYNR
jgi:hypothetical protein